MLKTLFISAMAIASIGSLHAQEVKEKPQKTNRQLPPPLRPEPLLLSAEDTAKEPSVPIKPRVASHLRDTLIAILTHGNYHPNYYLSASHRAQYVGGQEPENSMAALRDLFRDNKSDLVELDIKKSSDNQVYVMHDNYLQRTTDFLDKFLGVGQGSDAYGDYNNYTWAQVSTLTLRRADFTYTEQKVPLFKEVLDYIKNQTQSLINLDIGDTAVLRATWEVVKQEDAFDICIFKTARFTPEFFKSSYIDPLPQAQKDKVIFFPMIVMANPAPDGTDNRTPMQAYQAWEASGLAKGYEMGYRGNPSEDALLDVVDSVRAKNRVRVHVFNTYPDNYKGRYFGNKNIKQCCNDAADARGDWNYLLDPRGAGNYNRGVNGYIITDDPETMDEYLYILGKKNALH